jgi:autotransporter-associated beta strand protein
VYRYGPGLAPIRRFAAIVLASLVGPAFAFGQTPTNTWRANITGNWNLGSNWVGGVAPPAGGAATVVLEFPFAGTNYTATNNLGSPFQLNGLLFDGGGTGTLTLADAASSLQLAGTNPFVTQNSFATVAMSNFVALTAATTIGGFGSVALSGPWTGGVSAGSDAMVIDGTGTLLPVAGVPGGSLITVSGSNTFTGNVRLGNANLALGNNSALGVSANALVINAATNSLRFSVAGLTIPNPVTSNSTLTFAGSNAGTLSGVISGPGGVTVAGSGTLTLTAANGFTGATTVGVPNGGAGGLTLSGAGGLTATGSVVLAAGGTLSLVNTATANSTNRIADAAPVTFQNGGLAFTAAPAINAASGETFGPVTVQGGGSITVTAASQTGTSSVLQFGTLSRLDNGTLFIQNNSSSQSVGGGAPGPNRTNISFSGGLPTLADPAGASGGQNTAVVPFLSGNLSTSSFFGPPTLNAMSTVATYDANGVRLLNPADSTVFAQAFSGLVPHANNNMNGFVYNISGTTAVTSLVATAGPSLFGSGTIQVASGAVVAPSSMYIGGPILAFGTTTGYLHLGAMVELYNGSSITGSGGLVVTSANSSTLYLQSTAAANPLTGGLYVNGNASVSFTSDAQLGAAGQSITLNGGTLVGTGATVNRPIILGPGGGSAGGSSASTTFAGPITGGGGLTITNAVPGVTLSGANSYTGPTTVNGPVTLAGSNSGGGPTIINQIGTAYFTSASNFSSGPIILNGGALYSLPGGTFGRDLIAASSSGIATAAGQTLTYTGNLSGGGAFTAIGGTIALATATPPTAAVAAANGGILVVASPTSLQSAGVTAKAGGLVRLDDTGGTTRLGPNVPVSVQPGGELELDGANTATAENFGLLTTNGTVTVISGSGATANLHPASLSVPLNSPPALFRGTNLGSPAAGSARVTAGNLATGTLILNALADGSATGTGQDQAFYDTAGVRVATAGDFTSGPILQNAAPTNTQTTANFRVSGAVSTADNSNTVRSLRLEPGGTLTIPSGTLNAGGFIYAVPGGASTIAGPGTLQNLGDVLAMGDLTVSAMMANETLYKYGPGTMTVSGPASFSSLNVRAGTLVLNSGQTVAASTADVPANLVLGTASTNLQVSSNINEYSTTVISGPGSLTVNSTLLFAEGASTYSGGSIGGPNTEMVVFNPSALGSGPVTLNNTNGTANPTILLELVFGPGTFANDVNLPTTTSSSEIYGSGPVTMSGRLRGGSTAVGTAVEFSGTVYLSNPNNDFTATVVAGLGGATLGITSNSVLGNAVNTIQLNSGTLRFNADGIVVPRPISVMTFGGTFDTAGNRAEVSGVISGSGTVAKQGTGSLTLSGTNTFSGDLDVYAGSVLVTGSLAASTGSYGVDLESGATLSGTGTLNRKITGFGGTVNPGLPTATGKLTAASFVGGFGSTLAFRIDGPSPGDGLSLTGYDELVVGSGGVQLSSTALDVLIGGGFDPTLANTPIFIIDNQSTTAVSGTFKSLTNGAVVNLGGGYTAQISYFGDTATNSITGGNDVALYNFQVVPEPSSLVLGAVAATALAIRCRRRTRSIT